MVDARGNHGRLVSLGRVLPVARFIGCDGIDATACRDEATECRPGDVFVARATSAGDGHESVPLALSRGATAVVAERMVPTGGVPLCLVPDASWAHGRLCHALAGDPSRETRVIAVAGTSGKTTTAWLAAAALVEAGHRVGVLSDLGCLGPDDGEPATIDLAAPGALATTLARLVSAGCSHVVLEVSSGMLARHATAGMESHTVAVTSLAAAHLEHHATPRAYRGIVSRVIDTLVDDGCLVTDLASSWRRRIAAALPDGRTVVSAGLDSAADVHARSLGGSLAGRSFLLAAGGQVVPIAVDTPTVPFVRDAVTAAAIAVRHGVDLQAAARGIEAAGAVPGRLERIDRGQDAAVFIDTPTSMHAVAASLASLRRLTRGRLIVVADDRLARRLAGRGFAHRVARWSDACLRVPATIAAADPTPADVAAYARLDRLLGGLRKGDCAVVLGVPPRRGSPGPDPSGLAALVDGWLQLAHPAGSTFAPRRAA